MCINHMTYRSAFFAYNSPNNPSSILFCHQKKHVWLPLFLIEQLKIMLLSILFSVELKARMMLLLPYVLNYSKILHSC